MEILAAITAIITLISFHRVLLLSRWKGAPEMSPGRVGVVPQTAPHHFRPI